MSRNSSKSTRLKVVISVHHHVTVNLQDTDTKKAVFQSLYVVRSNLSMEHLFYDISVASYKVCNL